MSGIRRIKLVVTDFIILIEAKESNRGKTVHFSDEFGYPIIILSYEFEADTCNISTYDFKHDVCAFMFPYPLIASAFVGSLLWIQANLPPC